ncbi:hypothetical protein KW785_03405 [Candidatus Parcubacteria bacterium]|nr:hypothetical protein [Candidatus Parcubacteria bacterium]
MFNWHMALGILAGVIPFLAIIPYVKDILHGTTRPNVVSYSLWVFLLIISIWAQVSAGTSWSIIFLIGDLVGTSSVVALCLFGYGYGKYGRVEWICTALAILAVVSWQATHEPVLAIIFAIIADLMAAVPTVVKAYKDPWSEIPTAWFMIAAAALLGIASSTIFDLPNLLFPTYLFLINGTVGVLAFFGRRFKTKLT